MKKEKQTIEMLIRIIHTDLQELFEVKEISENRDFLLGQIYAYVECLEILQLCPAFRRLGIDYDVEKRYPLKLSLIHI